MDDGQRLIKCIVWDLDNTLWPGVAVESPDESLPEPDPEMLRIMDALEAQGIVSSAASRNDPALGKVLLEQPALAKRLIAPQVGWEPKSQAVKRIAERLNIGLDAIAFVDDSPFERAEVAYMLPQVLVLSPEEVRSSVQTLKRSNVQTPESSQRSEMYRTEESRRAAEEGFAGNRTDFLLSCDMHLNIAPAVAGDLQRIAELTERTHQLNSTGRQYTIEELRERMEDARWLMPAARLTDRFGDYGMIGAALVDREPNGQTGEWIAELIMLSCRVEGRGIPAALLTWIMSEAKGGGMSILKAVYRVNERNLPMRLLFRQMGFETVGEEADGLVTATRDLSMTLPPYAEWLHVNE